MADFYRREIFALGHFLTNMQAYRYQEVYQKFLTHLSHNIYSVWQKKKSDPRPALIEISKWARETLLNHPPSTLWELTCLSPQLANYWLKQTLPQGKYPRPELVLDELAHLPNGFNVSVPLDDTFLWNSVNRLFFQSQPVLERPLAISPSQPTDINLVLLQTLPNLLVTRKELKQFYGTPTSVERPSSESSYEWQPDISPVQQWQFGELLAAGGSSLTFNPTWLKAIGLLEIPVKAGDEHICRLCKSGGPHGELVCGRCAGQQVMSCDYCYDGWSECECGGGGCDECGGNGGWDCEECDGGRVECDICYDLPDEPNECPFKRFEKFWGQTVLETLVSEDPALAAATRLEAVEALLDQVPATLERLTTGRVTPHLLDREAAEELITRSYGEFDTDWLLFIPNWEGDVGFEFLYLPQYLQKTIKNKGISKFNSSRRFYFNGVGYGFKVGRFWATGWETSVEGKTFAPGSYTGHYGVYESNFLGSEKQLKRKLSNAASFEDFKYLALKLRPDRGVRALNFPQSS